MHLTRPLSLNPSSPSATDIADIAAIAQSALFSNELAHLRYANTASEEQLRWLTEVVCQEVQGLLGKPRISATGDGSRGSRGDDEDGDAVQGQVERVEHVVVHDLDLVPTTTPVPEQALLSSGQCEAAGESSPSSAQVQHDSSNSNSNSSHGGRIVAHAVWSYHPTHHRPPTTTSPSSSLPSTPPQPPPPQLPANANAPLIHHLNTLVDAAVAHHIHALAPCYVLDDLATLATHRRRGIASHLVKWVFPYADRDGVPVLLASSPMGYAVYRACGFEEVGGGGGEGKGVVEVDMGEWGGSGVHRHVLLVRWPESGRG